uniref:Uncharacterized protein n=1 Tax=Anguilla anguilla TaxID=7936 RepID=A0A0E9UZY1_ANGAN
MEGICKAFQPPRLSKGSSEHTDTL